MGADEAQGWLRDGLSIAAINKPSRCVISGPADAIEQIRQALAEQSIKATRLHLSVAAHSSLVEPILAAFAQCLHTMQLHVPSIPWVSNVTGTWITPQEATEPHYWVRHLRQMVRFSEGLQVLLDDPERLLLEVGPGQALSTFARQHPARTAAQSVLSSLRHPKEATPDMLFLLHTIGRLWLAGTEIDWTRLYTHERRHRVPLPTYPFDRQRCWIDPATTVLQPGCNGHMTSESPVDRTDALQTEIERPMGHVMSPTASTTGRKERIIAELKNILQELSGLESADIDVHATFLELGFDSLFLTQASSGFQKTFQAKITFRQLFEEAPTLDALAGYIDSQLPANAFAEPTLPSATSSNGTAPSPAPPPLARQDAVPDLPPTASAPQAPASASAVERIISQQLQVMAQQLALIRCRRPCGRRAR
jgi:acyl transferase domain-containing protein